MKLRVTLGLAVALSALATAAFAYPNLNGATGLVGIPNAYTVPSGQLVGAADYVDANNGFIFRGIYGLSPNLEVGATASLADNDGFSIGGKYRIPADIAGFDTAFGLTYADLDEVGSGFQVSFTGTQPLSGSVEEGNLLLWTLGVNFTDFEDASAIRPYTGAQLLLSPRTEVGGEFMLEAGDFNESIFSLYVRQRFNAALSGQIGFTNAVGFTGTDDAGLFVGASYVFSGPGATE